MMSSNAKTNYSELMSGNFHLSASAVEFLEGLTGKATVTFSERADKNGCSRVYISTPQVVYTAGGRAYRRMVTRYLGQARAGRSAYHIQHEAIMVLIHGAGNYHASKWFLEKYGKKAG